MLPETSPIFIVGPPRTGLRLLFETLRDAKGVFTREDGAQLEPLQRLPRLNELLRDRASDRLVTADALIPGLAERYREVSSQSLRDRDDRTAEDGSPITFLDLTLPNVLRVPFLAAVFPHARFIVVHRDPAATVSSIAEGWESQRYARRVSPPEWTGLRWSFPLTPGWRDLMGKPPIGVAAGQWSQCIDTLLADLDHLEGDRWVTTSYEELVDDPPSAIGGLCARLRLEFDRRLPASLPLTQTVLSPPAAGKWRDLHPRADKALAPFAQTIEAWGRLAPARTSEPPVLGAPRRGRAELFASSYTDSFTELLAQHRVSLMVSTYQSGRVICMRRDGDALDTFFRTFPSPMGLAVTSNAVAVATRRAVHDYHHHSGALAQLQPPQRYDGCYLPRNTHVTGDIGIHEIAFTRTGLWLVSTRFSCLATMDAVNSFVPRWRPPWITALVPEDRCHLNGLAVVEGEVRYGTALGETDTAGGWREGKGTSGVVVEVPSGEVVTRGLSMPHSPRWYDGRLWVLESGRGALVTIDPVTGMRETVGVVPGFARGLAFTGHVAWIGLSQVRETVFRGLPVSSSERACGVWALDIRSGDILGYVQFEGTVQEIFDVQTCPRTYPFLAVEGDDVVAGAFVIPAKPEPLSTLR